MSIIASIPRTERHLMQKTIHKTKDNNHARRLTAMLMLHRGDTVSHVARTLCCTCSSIGRWINWFTLSGAEGLKSLPSGHGRRWPFEHICALLRELIKHSPGDFGYPRNAFAAGDLLQRKQYQSSTDKICRRGSAGVTGWLCIKR